MGYSAYARQLPAADQEAYESVYSTLFGPSGQRSVCRIADLVEHLTSIGRVDNLRSLDKLDAVHASAVQEFVDWEDRKSDLRNLENVRLAGEAQYLLESVIVDTARIALDVTGETRLCLAGGSMMNTVAVERILRETAASEVFVQPAANDAGTAIGAAYFGLHQLKAVARTQTSYGSHSTYLGCAYQPTEVDSALRANSAVCATLPLAMEDMVERAIADLARGAIIAVSRGRSEFGPRALGNRSFLASPQHVDARDSVNRIKRRPWYQPVAPAVPVEALHTYFDAPFRSSPFMTVNAQSAEVTQRLAPAVVHADGSARVQSVDRNDNPFFHELLVRFAAATGLPPILINSSFNIDEPIVETPADALCTFARCPIDVVGLVLEDRYVTRSPG